MAESQYIQHVLNGTVSALKSIVPAEAEFQSPVLLTGPFIQQEMGVLIGIFGDLKSRIIVDSSATVFSAVSQSMYGMALEGEMLESFTGELGNMIAGSVCTFASEKSVSIDITPPTVIVGQSRMSGFRHAFRIDAAFEGIGSMSIILMLDEHKLEKNAG